MCFVVCKCVCESARCRYTFARDHMKHFCAERATYMELPLMVFLFAAVFIVVALFFAIY